MHEDNSFGNALADNALALAMGFFCIMVLALTLMSLDPEAVEAAARQQPGQGANETLALRPATTDARAAQVERPSAQDRIVVFHGGRFLDTALAPVDPGAIKAEGRVFLAVDPGLPIDAIMAARLRLPFPNVEVTMLSAQWLTRLKDIAHGTP